MFALNLKENITSASIKSVAELATSRISGFIVYNQKHANVAKVVTDPFCWNEFDAISGANWPIFCVRPLIDKYSDFTGTNHFGASHMTTGKNGSNINQQILSFFGLKDSEEDLPCFVLFAWDDRENLCMNAYKIDFETIDSTHKSLRDIISVISQVEKIVLPEYKSTTSVYRNASFEIDALRAREKFHRLHTKADFWLHPVRELFEYLIKKY